MKVKIWGARGSLPVPRTPAEITDIARQSLNRFFDRGHTKNTDIELYLQDLKPQELGGYGGNSPCLEVDTGQERIIIDGGSGIRPLGYDLMNGPCGKGQGEAHIFFTHFHWDHVIGLPFFTPIFIPGNKIHVYAVQDDLERMFKTVFQKPFFPLELTDLGGEIIYHKLEPRKPFSIGGATVTPYQLDHPDPCWGMKFEMNGKAFSHCVDTEAKRTSREDLGPDLPLYEGIDLMTFDAQYTIGESMDKIDWGHAAAPSGLDIAMREGVKRVRFMHYDPAATDEQIAKGEKEAENYYLGKVKAHESAGTAYHMVDWAFVREGDIFEV